MRTQHIDDMDHKQIIALTEEELNRMIDYLCAENGVPILRCPEPPGEKPTIDKDEVIYRVEGTMFAVKDRELAGKISMFLVENSDKIYNVKYDYKIGSEYEYLEPIKEQYRSNTFGAVTKADVYTRTSINQHAVELAKYKGENSDYQREKAEFEKNSEKRQRFIDEVYGYYRDHVSAENNLEHSRLEFERYLELADGDTDMAFRFYEKAYSPNPWTSYHLRKLVGMEVEEEEPVFYAE